MVIYLYEVTSLKNKYKNMTIHQAKGIIFVHTVIFTVAIIVGLLSLFVTPVSVQDTGVKAPTAQVDDRDGNEFCDLTVVECGSEPAVEEKVSMAKPKTPTQSRQQAVQAKPLKSVQGFPVSDTIKKTLKDVCRAKGFDDNKCWKVLAAMAWTESRFDGNAQGDYTKKAGYRSHGYFQIQTRMHKVSLKCATDLSCSAEWTLNRLISKGYGQGYDKYSVKRHNGAGVMADRYVAKVYSHIAKIQ